MQDHSPGVILDSTHRAGTLPVPACRGLLSQNRPRLWKNAVIGFHTQAAGWCRRLRVQAGCTWLAPMQNHGAIQNAALESASSQHSWVEYRPRLMHHATLRHCQEAQLQLAQQRTCARRRPAPPPFKPPGHPLAKHALLADTYPRGACRARRCTCPTCRGARPAAISPNMPYSTIQDEPHSPHKSVMLSAPFICPFWAETGHCDTGARAPCRLQLLPLLVQEWVHPACPVPREPATPVASTSSPVLLQIPKPAQSCSIVQRTNLAKRNPATPRCAFLLQTARTALAPLQLPADPQV